MRLVKFKLKPDGVVYINPPFVSSVRDEDNQTTVCVDCECYPLNEKIETVLAALYAEIDLSPDERKINKSLVNESQKRSF